MAGAEPIRGTRFRWRAVAVGAAVAMMTTVLSAMPAAVARVVSRRSVSAVSLPAEGFRAVGSDGGVFDFGTNRYLGSLPGEHVVPAAPVVGMAPTPDGLGYWLVGSDGGVFSFRDARFLGSLGGVHLDAPVVGMAATPDGKGYWLVGADGGVFSFGDAGFFGSLGGVRLDAPIVGIASAFSGVGSSGRHPGYWLVGRDGGVFALGAPYFGSLLSKGVHVSDVVGLTPAVDNQGYWVARSDGTVYTFGSAPFIGDFQTAMAAEGHPGGTLAAPWVGLSTVAPPGAAPVGPGPAPAGPAPAPVGTMPVVALAYGPGTGPAERDGSTATAKVTVDLNGGPDADAPVTVEVSGANEQILQGTTDATGTVFVPYIGSATGVDSLTATSGPGQSGSLTIDWSTPASLYSGTRLSLSPSAAGPDTLNQTQTLTATLSTSAGRPLANMFVPWKVTGANTASGTAVTNASGQARFAYSGTAAGVDTVTATFQAGTVTVRSNPATVTWQAPTGPLATVSLGPVTGDFYAENPQTTTFQATPEAKPAFAQTFPDIEFNPPAGAVPGDTSGITPATRPFTDVTTDGLGNADGYTIAQGNGHQAGVGTLAAFDAVLRGSFQVSRPGSQTFELFRSDGFILGVGGGATATGNIDVNPPAGGVTTFAGLPVLASDNQVNTGPGPDTITVEFPAAGSYPFELDYLSRSAATGSGQMSLALTTQSNTTGLKVSFAYADNTTTPAAGTFPSPWSGSSGVTFVGGPGPYDSGAIQIQNTTSTPIPLDGVTVDIGSQHYNPWSGQSLTVPASGSLVLAGSGSSFDTSESVAPQPSTLPPGSGFAFGTYASGFPNSGDIGPTGVAQDPQGNFYATDYSTGGLYRFGSSGGVASASTLVKAYSGTPQGLAFSRDYHHLYMTLVSAGQVVEIDPTTGVILRTVASNLVAGGIAVDPITGDLVVSEAGRGATIYVIANPQSATPTVTSFNAGATIDGIAVGPHGTIYADTCCGSGFLMLDGVGSATPGKLIKEVQSNQLYGTDGIALLPPGPGQTSPTVVQNSNNGVIFEIQDPLSANPTISTIYSGGTRGDFVTVGADGCLYATQSSTILKGTAADGSCPFIPFGCPAATTVPQVHILANGQVSTYQDTGLALTSEGVDGDHCGGSNESVPWTPAGATPPSGPPVPPSGSLRLSPWAIGDKTVGTSVTVEVQAMTATGQPAPSGTPVALTVSGPNAATLSATTTAIGLATFSYTGINAGLDSLVATASPGGAGPPEVSNTLTVGWYVPVPATPAPTGAGSGLSPPSITGLSPGSGADLTAATVPVSAVVTAAGSPVASWSAAIAPAGGTATQVGSGSGAPPPTLGSITTTGLASGQYQITVKATSAAGGTSSVTETVSLQAPPPGPPPAISSVGPTPGGVTTTPIPITASIAAPSGQIITAWSVTYQLGSATPVTLASGTGTPPSTLATFDPTTLPDGTYVITVHATASGGGTQIASTSAAVTGNLKPGRYTATYQDVSVPVDGFQMTVDRTYDSLDKSTGAFGVGWNLSVADFKVTSNGPLGAGGWSQYDPMCYYALCTTAYRSSKPHYVTVTWPDGHDEVFDFTPTGGTSLFPSVGPGFTAQPGTNTTSTLSAAAPIAGMTAGGDLVDYAGSAYSPTVFTLTTASGEVLTLSTVTGLVSMQDPNGNTLTVDSSGVHASNGQSLTFTRDSSGRITSVTTPTGAVYSYSYDAAGDLTTVTPPAPASPDTYTYDSNHDLLSQSGPGGPVLSMTYDPTGRLVKITDALGNATTITNNVGQRQVIVADPNGKLTTVYTYDSAGNLIQEDETAGGTTLTQKWTYDGLGDPTSYTDANGNTSTATYDSQGDQTSTTDADGRTTRYSYNSLGELIALTKPDGTPGAVALYSQAGNATQVESANGAVNTLTYSPEGQLLSDTDPLGNTTTYSYDSQGRLNGITEPDGLTEQVTTDSSGRPTSVTNPDGQTTTLAYDAVGNLSSLTDANGHTWSYSYNGLGQQTAATDPLGRTTTTAYNSAGQITSSTNADGQVVTYSYDSDGKIVQQSSSGDTISFGYDAFGRLISAADPAASYTFGYDPAAHVTSETSSITGGPAVTFNLAYDPTGNLTALQGPGGTSAYTYDANAQLSSVSGPSATAYTFGYTSGGLLASELQDSLAQTYTYDPAGQLTGISDSGPSGTLASFAYTYNAEGRRTTVTTPAGKTIYGYDGAGQLTNVAYPAGGPPSGSYTYDPVGNRLSSPTQPAGTLVYDAADQLTNAGPVTYTYNGEGEPITATDSATRTKTTYTWNALGQLSGIDLPGGQTESLAYDPFGQRVSVISGSQGHAYVYLGMQPDAVYNGSGTPSRTYTQAPGQNSPLGVTQAGAADTILRDALGSTIGLANSSGGLTMSYSYRAFGTPAGSVPTGPAFTGQFYDSASGLYYDNSRYYNPSTGRFLSTDPLPASNPYDYVANDPTNLTDPSGATLTGTAIRDYISSAVESTAADRLSGCLFGALGSVATTALTGGNGQDLLIGGATSCAIGLLLGGTPSSIGNRELQIIFVKNIIGGALSGAISSGAEQAANCGLGNWSNILKAAGLGAGYGAISGLVSGGITGLNAAALQFPLSVTSTWGASRYLLISPSGAALLGTAAGIPPALVGSSSTPCN